MVQQLICSPANRTTIDGSIALGPQAYCSCGPVVAGINTQTSDGVVYSICAGEPFPTIASSTPTLPEPTTEPSELPPPPPPQPSEAIIIYRYEFCKSPTPVHTKTPSLRVPISIITHSLTRPSHQAPKSTVSPASTSTKSPPASPSTLAPTEPTTRKSSPWTPPTSISDHFQHGATMILVITVPVPKSVGWKGWERSKGRV